MADPFLFGTTRIFCLQMRELFLLTEFNEKIVNLTQPVYLVGDLV